MGFSIGLIIGAFVETAWIVLAWCQLVMFEKAKLVYS